MSDCTARLARRWQSISPESPGRGPCAPRSQKSFSAVPRLLGIHVVSSAAGTSAETELSQTKRHLLLHYGPFHLSLPPAWFSTQRNSKTKSLPISTFPQLVSNERPQEEFWECPQQVEKPQGAISNSSEDLRATCLKDLALPYYQSPRTWPLHSH